MKNIPVLPDIGDYVSITGTYKVKGKFVDGNNVLYYELQTKKVMERMTVQVKNVQLLDASEMMTDEHDVAPDGSA